LVNWGYVSQSVFGGVIRSTPEIWQPLMSVIALLAVQMLVLHWMYRRKIFVSV